MNCLCIDISWKSSVAEYVVIEGSDVDDTDNETDAEGEEVKANEYMEVVGNQVDELTENSQQKSFHGNPSPTLIPAPP